MHLERPPALVLTEHLAVPVNIILARMLSNSPYSLLGQPTVLLLLCQTLLYLLVDKDGVGLRLG